MQVDKFDMKQDVTGVTSEGKLQCYMFLRETLSLVGDCKGLL